MKDKACEKGTMNQEIEILGTMEGRHKTTTIDTGSFEKTFCGHTVSHNKMLKRKKKRMIFVKVNCGQGFCFIK
jgi:transcription elongation factor Elf1